MHSRILYMLPFFQVSPAVHLLPPNFAMSEIQDRELSCGGSCICEEGKTDWTRNATGMMLHDSKCKGLCLFDNQLKVDDNTLPMCAEDYVDLRPIRVMRVWKEWEHT
eukprot:TRINITY_DN23755_c0_g1_i1.p1 TRINITY_DN23755_c0_g1~~TRINITY_DN23755_c0_g1_i1.p1  ORF type:complete len:107 (+),score=5.97 TRINITY_DN23755_c0_g1_i1:251-571(+)